MVLSPSSVLTTLFPNCFVFSRAGGMGWSRLANSSLSSEAILHSSVRKEVALPFLCNLAVRPEYGREQQLYRHLPGCNVYSCVV